MTEEWRPILGFPGYEVSDLGRVRSHKRPLPRILRQSPHPNGYLKVGLWNLDVHRYNPATLLVHKLVMLAFEGPRPDGLEVRHLNGDQTNNALSNLAYGTPAENAADSVAHGTHRQVRKTHCPEDHPYDEANTGHWQGHRYCRTCRRAHQAAYRERQAFAAASVTHP